MTEIPRHVTRTVNESFFSKKNFSVASSIMQDRDAPIQTRHQLGVMGNDETQAILDKA